MKLSATYAQYSCDMGNEWSRVDMRVHVIITGELCLSCLGIATVGSVVLQLIAVIQLVAAGGYRQ
jgi:hypothetical protein